MAKSEDNSNPSGVFDSVDFNDFLHQKLLRSSDSVNGPGNGILVSSDLSLFKSKESFISGFLSKDWDTKGSGSKTLHAGHDAKPRMTAANAVIPASIATPNDTSISKDGKHMIQKSQDWMKFNTLGKHVEIPYSMGIFSANVASKQQSEATPTPPSIRTNLNIPRTMLTQETAGTESSIPNPASTVENTPKKKRKRAPRKKIIPQNKKYMEYSDNDVLMGRGGKSNHHPGNERYRAQIDRLQERYKLTDDKDEKTNMSAELVQHVQSYGGHFLEKDDKGWYVIDDVVARRKVSQALREDKDPEKRRAKRARFLAKRERLEQEARIKQAKIAR